MKLSPLAEQLGDFLRRHGNEKIFGAGAQNRSVASTATEESDALVNAVLAREQGRAQYPDRPFQAENDMLLLNKQARVQSGVSDGSREKKLEPTASEEALDKKITSILEQKGAFEALLRELNGEQALPNQRIFLADLHVDDKGARVTQQLSGKRYGEGGKDHLDPIIVKCRPVYDPQTKRYSLVPVKGKAATLETLTADLDGATVLGELRTKPGDGRPRIYIARVARLPEDLIEKHVAMAQTLERESPVLPSPITLRRTEREAEISDVLSLLLEDRSDAARDAYTRVVSFINGSVTGDQRILPAYVRISGADVELDAVLDGADFGYARSVTNRPFVRGTLTRHRAPDARFEMRSDSSREIKVTADDNDRLVLAKFGVPGADGTFSIAIARLDQLDQGDAATIAEFVAAALPPEPDLTRIPSNQVIQHEQSGQGSDGAKAEEPEPSKV